MLSFNQDWLPARPAPYLLHYLCAPPCILSSVSADKTLETVEFFSLYYIFPDFKMSEKFMVIITNIAESWQSIILILVQRNNDHGLEDAKFIFIDDRCSLVKVKQH